MYVSVNTIFYIYIYIILFYFSKKRKGYVILNGVKFFFKYSSIFIESGVSKSSPVTFFF